MCTRRPRLYLHVGTPKTGTTFLQDVCWHNRELLAGEGVRYPGEAWDSQFHGALEVMSARFPDWRDSLRPGTWRRIVEQVRAHNGTAIISHELLCPASPEEAGRILADLAFAEVHIVCTARNLASQIPSVWQEDVKNGHALGFGEFLDDLRTEPSPPGTMADVFWSFQDLPRILRTWAAELPVERVHLLTVPRGADLLWPRFAGLVGVHPDRYDTTAVQSNTSLGASEVELLRRINIALAGRLDNDAYQTLVKYLIATDTLAVRDGKQPIVLPAQDRAWVRARAERFVAEIIAAGYHVVGDLAELVPRADVGDAASVASEGEMLDAAVDSIRVLVERLADERLADERLADERRAAEPGHRIRQALVDLSQQHRPLRWLRRTLRAH